MPNILPPGEIAMILPSPSRLALGTSLGLLLVMAFSQFSAARAAESDLEKEFRSAQRGIQAQLKNKNRDQRLAAVKKLEDFPVVDAAKVLLASGLGSGDDEVRRASYGALLKSKEDKAIGLFLALEVEKDLKRGAVDEGTCGAMGVLLASTNKELEPKADQLLAQAAGIAANSSGLLLLVTVADELGAEGTPESLKSLLKLSKLPLFGKNFAFRRAVTQGLMRVRQIDAVSTLIEMLTSAQGEVRSDILRYLTAISGENIGQDPMMWAGWWKASKAMFKFPDPAKPLLAARAKAPPQGEKSYYGLPLANRLVFIMDTSASMRGARIEAAKRELIRAISELPETTEFAVMVFNNRVTAWQEKLVPATSENRELACRFVFAQELGPQTASYDALEAALTFDAEAIYFLTDGAPFGGKVTQPVQIITVITKLNRLRRMTINSIGIGVGANGNVFDQFLKALADNNYGQYIRVDE
ncbi:MAG: VWA domain-containing protein [Planctomycetales bacterium]|nr:VWA domain-containing protein [Planctomycetales bacterium]